jgi:RNA polymerase sigma-70 factor (ECF subfamily)
MLMNPSQPTDEEIASNVQKGDIQQFGELVIRYEVKMKRYARKFLFGYHDSQDMVQDVFLKAYTNIRGFDTTRKFSSWLYRIAHNEFINAIKKKGHEPLAFFDTDTLFPHPVANQNVEKEMDLRQTQDILNKCLDKLDPKYREPLVLFYFEDQDYQSISEIMHIPVSTVGVRLGRAKIVLKEIYSKLNNHGQ